MLKRSVKTNFDDLLIVGYQSHIFRDDEKALFIDSEKHLIPWMGDRALRIDRLIPIPSQPSLARLLYGGGSPHPLYLIKLDLGT